MLNLLSAKIGKSFIFAASWQRKGRTIIQVVHGQAGRL
jgi:hypothetical protein